MDSVFNITLSLVPKPLRTGGETFFDFVFTTKLDEQFENAIIEKVPAKVTKVIPAKTIVKTIRIGIYILLFSAVLSPFYYLPYGYNFIYVIFLQSSFKALYNSRVVNKIQPNVAKLPYQDVLDLNTRLDKHVLAQKEAADTVAKAMWNYASGLKDPDTPIGVFLFLGPSGCGKTELAKALAIEFFKNEALLSRFDMSQYVEPHSMARLLDHPQVM